VYISSYFNRFNETVYVWEKTESHGRICREYPASYYFYVPAETGTYEAITGEKLERLDFESFKEYEAVRLSYPHRFESDFSPLERTMFGYADKPVPVLVIGFIDIEVDYDPLIGFPTLKNPYAPINAITLYRTDYMQHFTFAVIPKTLNEFELPTELVDKNYFLVATERQLIESFLKFIEDTDLLSGWNSEFFDLPYIGKRIELLFGEHALKRLGFDKAPKPRWNERLRYKGATDKDIVLEITGRVHLDYMLLFKKFNLKGRQSYSLQAITNEELEIPKLQYEGTLHDLYHNNFQKFLEYNRHDVQCLVDLDNKFKYIELANQMVHEATVNFNSIFGSVQLIDTAIINYCHVKLNKIVTDKKHSPNERVEGAIVMTPHVGLHKMIGSCDINSLYPSTYRSLNLSPEKIFGQLQEQEEGWKRVYQARINPTPENLSETLTLIIEADLTSVTLTVGELIDFLVSQQFSLSAYGTILDQSAGNGLLPEVFSFWFKDRKRLQALKEENQKIADTLKKEQAITIPPDLIESLIKSP